MITAHELRQMRDRRPVTEDELDLALVQAQTIHGIRRIDSENFNDRPLTDLDADALRKSGYEVHVMGDTRWSIQW